MYLMLVIYSKKEIYNAEIKIIKNKYFITSDYNKLTNNLLDTKITRRKLVNESGLNEKIKCLTAEKETKILSIKTELKAEQDSKIVKLQAYDLTLFIGQSYFFSDGASFYLIFSPFYHPSKTLDETENVASWKYTTPTNPFLTIIFLYQLTVWRFKFLFIIFVYNSTFTPTKRINFFIVRKLDDLDSGFTLKDCLIGGVKLVKNVDLDIST